MFGLDSIRWVLNQFLAATACREFSPLGNRGGFSGARLWRVQTPVGPFCLRAWPERGTDGQHLTRVHGLMTRGYTLALQFVPAVMVTRSGPTWVEHSGRLWD